MKNTLLVAAAIGALFMLFVSGVMAAGIGTDLVDRVPEPNRPSADPGAHQATRLETLWIFDADFEDLAGDNAGWTAWDRSGTLGQDNYWHHDTLRINGYAYLGDSTWWCGTYNECWRQPRGYANNWIQILERHFTEASALSGALTLEYDQRYAMEKDYDYGYVDIRSSATADTWKTVSFVTNPGFAGTAGRSQDWNSVVATGPGHMVIDISPEGMGLEFDLRFRVVTDAAYSSQDQYNNPPLNSVLDGAWQLDNITLYDDGSPIFADDAESGDMGWVTDDLAPAGQTGVTFYRGRFGYDFVTGRDFTCDDRPLGSWMYAAVDPFTSKMVNDEYAWLMSPPIDVSGAAKLVGQWDQWVDLPRPANDIFNLWLASNDNAACVTDPAGFVDESPGWWYGGPFWGVWNDDWDAFAGNDWLAVLWGVQNDDVPEEPHMAGLFVNRQRVGIPSGDAGTTWNYGTWDRFNDWYQEQLTDALLDSAIINVKDDDDIASVTVIATNGITTNSYPARRLDPFGNDWICDPPATEMIPGAIIHYYFEAMDGVGTVSTYPDDAPDVYYEISILPIEATVTSPGILLIDKHGRLTPGDRRDYFHSSEYYFREMLDILGYEYEKYDVEVPSGSTDQSNGPDSCAFKYYDTQIWFTDEFDAYTIKAPDQANLVAWLNQAPEKERNLLITGNDWGYELEAVGKETMSFYEVWMASEYIQNSVGTVTVDSIPGIKEVAGGFTFMDHDDGQAILRGGCPQLAYFDVVDADPGIPGVAVALNYEKLDSTELPAGTYYTHQTYGYQTVNLGFGMEFISDGIVGSSTNLTPEGYFKGGVEDRVNLMGNIMEFFNVNPSGPGTGVVDGVRNELSHAFPNPFNPVTKIAYSVKEAGPVTIQVYNVAGKVVRTLLSTEVDAGATGYVVWDGTNDGGENCASGVYFYRIAAPGFTESHKMIMLK
ncbi:MAG: T9SS type A sorting domain-containing protein [Candidatus Eisenbacteria bacterium]|nr:T9SS type A sorting domain-containing protein [Candidatus Eisenbacteria bacterium]